MNVTQSGLSCATPTFPLKRNSPGDDELASSPKRLKSSPEEALIQFKTVVSNQRRIEGVFMDNQLVRKSTRAYRVLGVLDSISNSAKEPMPSRRRAK